MNLFDKLVDEALGKSNGSNIRPVVEKELLHYDILREMSKAGFLRSITFMGGTCLRACYGAQRLSEDLDFTGGTNFKKENLTKFSQVIIDRLHEKYELDVSVSRCTSATAGPSWPRRVPRRRTCAGMRATRSAASPASGCSARSVTEPGVMPGQRGPPALV